MFIVILYALFGIKWGLFSVAMQKKFHPNRSDKRDLILNFIVNSLIFPISMLWAGYRYVTKTAWAKNL